ncbi:hypothetical protein OB236_32430 [Paenibacillus sp. WQ 127069]|uniref:protein acetyllysine N-acetyltransferase n=1 Tax=Paenibacillus baimaensis TaxID=2982185 RepID=A0ABT2UQA5_9BACL|nr:Sir2 family NAD-dependent protein deacetylase [Paenibacillus sp. WQ 127069]MCU6796843.1 hypothetical protein [Paenibacillus sp. WQ 127069]
MNFNELKQMVDESSNIGFFGGAGTSTESGIPDFQSADGLYNAGTDESYTPEEMLSRDFFMKRTGALYNFYESKMIYPDTKPNLAHEALVKLEQRGQLKAKTL